AGLQILWLRICAVSIAAAVTLLLLGLGWFVILPATRTIRAQVDELESRVPQPPCDLSDANQALEHETSARQEADTQTHVLAVQLAHGGRVRTVGQLTAGLSHELNPPLAAIANYTETCDLLLSLKPNFEHKRPRAHLQQIKEAALRAG